MHSHVSRKAAFARPDQMINTWPDKLWCQMSEASPVALPETIFPLQCCVFYILLLMPRSWAAITFHTYRNCLVSLCTWLPSVIVLLLITDCSYFVSLAFTTSVCLSMLAAVILAWTINAAVLVPFFFSLSLSLLLSRLLLLLLPVWLCVRLCS